MSWHFFQCKIMSRSKKAVKNHFSGPWRAQWHAVSHTLCWNCFHATHHVGLPQRFTHAVHLLWAGAAHDKVLRHHGATDQIQGADERLKGFGIQPSNDRLDVVWPEPGGDHSGCQGWVSRYSSAQRVISCSAQRECTHLLSYNRLDTMLMKVLGLIWRPSFSSYRFSRNLSLWDLSKEDISL